MFLSGRRPRFTVSLAAAVAVVAAAFAPVASGAKGHYLRIEKQTPVASVSDVIKTNISVFRQTDPVTVPDSILKMTVPDKKDGKTMLGMNGTLARPAYPDAEKQEQPVWFVPAANDVMFAFQTNPDGTGAGGGGSVSSKDFLDHGSVMWQPGREGSNHHTPITVVLPDSITTVRIKTKAPGKKRHYRTYTAHDNVVVANPKYADAVVVNGHKVSLRIFLPKRRR
jgi:hypothetical protein